ncbi:MAG: hypothetical protein HGGPFJEG_01445 [Ignavibacteria bacterium]|nr:hypothetical protein [Ignavibacteria bacterium]
MKIDYRKCPKCKNSKHFSAFPKGRCSYCKDCMKIYLRAYKNKVKRSNAWYHEFDTRMLTDADMEIEMRGYKSPKTKQRLNALIDFTKKFESLMRTIKSFNPKPRKSWKRYGEFDNNLTK